MSRRDAIHDKIVQALINDNWEITDDPLYVKVKEKKGFEIDLGAEKIIMATKDKKKIGVEIKSFLATTVLHAFHGAFGQYIIYRDALELNEMEHELYLAISDDVLEKLMEIEFIEQSIKKYNIKILVVNLETEKIIQWIK